MIGQWSVHEKVAYVQTAHPRRNVAQQRVLRERNHNSPDLTDLSIDWTGYQEDQARHNAWELHTDLNKITGSYADLYETNFFKGCSPFKKNTHPRPNRSQSRRTGCIFVDSGVSLHMLGESSFSPQEKKTVRQTKNLTGNPTVPQWTRRFTSRKSALACTGSWWKIRLRHCLMDACVMSYGISYSWHRQSRPSRRGHSAESHSIRQARSCWREPCARCRSGGNHAKIARTLL